MLFLSELLFFDIAFVVISFVCASCEAFILCKLFMILSVIFCTFTALEYFRLKKENVENTSTSEEDQRRKMIDEKIEKARATIQSILHREMGYIFDKNKEAIGQINVFKAKEKVLDMIIGLNEGGCATTLHKNSLDVYETLGENYRRISKRLVAYNTTFNKDIQKEIDNLLNANDMLLNLYNRLIDEVSRMGDNLNEQDESLQNLIADLQELRKRNEQDEDESDEENPFKFETFPPKDK